MQSVKFVYIIELFETMARFLLHRTEGYFAWRHFNLQSFGYRWLAQRKKEDKVRHRQKITVQFGHKQNQYTLTVRPHDRDGDEGSIICL